MADDRDRPWREDGDPPWLVELDDRIAVALGETIGKGHPGIALALVLHIAADWAVFKGVDRQRFLEMADEMFDSADDIAHRQDNRFTN